MCSFTFLDRGERTVLMGTPAYNEQDYTFGQAVLTLRMAIGLTQAELADTLGVSRRAVGEWEAGGSYPKTHHLKEFISLAVKSQAFHSGYEAVEIRRLWKAAHQKVLLDEDWLSALLSQPFSQETHGDSGQERAAGVQPSQPVAPTSQPAVVRSPQPTDPKAGPRVDWDDALAVPLFYGREEELAQLTQWVVQERCRVVG